MIGHWADWSGTLRDFRKLLETSVAFTAGHGNDDESNIIF